MMSTSTLCLSKPYSFSSSKNCKHLLVLNFAGEYCKLKEVVNFLSGEKIRNRTLCLFASMIMSFYSFANAPLKKIKEENEQAVFLLECYNAKNQIISTSNGFFIDGSGIAISNIRFLKKASKAKIRTVEGKTYDVERLLDYNTGLGLAKIKVNIPASTRFKSVKISDKLYKKGDEIYTFNKEDDGNANLTSGTILNSNSLFNYGICYQISASLDQFGGVPVFNSAGEVIAITTFANATENNPGLASDFAVNIGSLNMLTNKVDSKFEKATKEIVFEDFVPDYMQAVILKNYGSALNICDKYIAGNPNSWLAYHYKAMIEIEEKKYHEAEANFAKALQINRTPYLKEVDYLGLGKAYKQTKQFEKSKDAYMQALNYNGKSARCYCELSELADEWLGPENAVVEESYFKALAIDSASCPFGYRTIGYRFLQMHEFKKGIFYLTKAIETETDLESLSISYFNRGNCYYELGYTEDAINDYENSIKTSPDAFESFISVGLCYKATGRKAEANASFQKALEVARKLELGEAAEAKVAKAIGGKPTKAKSLAKF